MGDWNAAIAAAPAVSLAYWADMAARRAEAIAREGGVRRAGVADAPGGGQARRRRRRAGGGGTRGRRLRRGVRGGRRRVPVAGSLGGGRRRAARGAPRRISARPVFPRNAGKRRTRGTRRETRAALALGGASGTRSSLSPLPPLRVAGKMKMLAAARARRRARARRNGRIFAILSAKRRKRVFLRESVPFLRRPPRTSPRPRARCARRRRPRRLAHGDAVGAAAARLSVGDARRARRRRCSAARRWRWPPR